MARLIGSPPGYVNNDVGGQLTKAVRKNPKSIVLFDEMEKAHPDVFNVLLQVLDDGRLTDGLGNTVSFKETVIIFTSNIGSADILEMGSLFQPEEVKERIVGLLKKQLRPEFLNRFDEFVVFNPLKFEEILAIVSIEVEVLAARLVESNNMNLTVTDGAKYWLAKKGYSVEFGARALKRTIQREVTTQLTRDILTGKFKRGAKIVMDVAVVGDTGDSIDDMAVAVLASKETLVFTLVSEEVNVAVEIEDPEQDEENQG